MLDGKPSDFTLDDLRRRNTISILLSDWGLIRLARRDQITETTDLKKIKIISFKEKSNWKLQEKYAIGNVKKYK